MITFDDIRMQNVKGIDISLLDSSFVNAAVRERMDELKLNSEAAYWQLLNSSDEEADIFRSRLQNSYSEFFRNTFSFAFLRHFILPELVLSGQEVRVWSAAAAAGQEAYSLAILFDEFFRKTNTKAHLQIVGTDISEEQLVKARTGVYTEASLDFVTLKRLHEYFKPVDGFWSVSERLKEYVRFERFDLTDVDEDKIPGGVSDGFQLVFCANVLMYYGRKGQKRILERIHRHLTPGGYLFVSEVERQVLDGIPGFELLPLGPIAKKIK